MPQAALSLEAYCLLLPGQHLALSALLAAKKIRGRGNKEGALGAFRQTNWVGWKHRIACLNTYTLYV